MAELQTSTDLNGQKTRIALYFGSGVAAGVALSRGIITQDLVDQIPLLIGAIGALGGSLAWWNKAQKKVVTVEGLKASTAPGSSIAAAQVEAVIRNAKAEGKP